jgi:sialic acid synthase SpsE
MAHTYVIGEVGQNHNGSMIIAKEIIDRVAQPQIDELTGEALAPMDAVKFTKRDLKEELTDSAMRRPYSGRNSFGATYGEHRQALELNDEQHFELYQYAKERGLEFVETLCARGCLTMLNHFKPDKLKVASRDLTNLPLLEAMAETKIPMILSTGMGGPKELNDALDAITKYHQNVSILHCISQYPAEYKNINLETITWLKEQFPQYKIGYSDHSIGIMIPVAAVAMGAEIIEKHITLDRDMRGTDQKGSLAPDGIHRMMRDIRNLEHAFGEKGMFISEAVQGSKVKLQRSIASRRDLKVGDVIQENDIHMLSPGDGVQWADRDSMIGKKLTQNIAANEIIYPNFFS